MAKKKGARYRCPECKSDMTEQVESTCKEMVVRPLVVEELDAVGGSESTECVTLQCPKGHWAEYDCPGGKP